MKTWSEDNWLISLDRLLEGRRQKQALPKDSLITDGKQHKKLDIDNIDDFPELKTLLFEYIPDDDTSYTYNHPSSRLWSLAYGIAYRDDTEGVCRKRAEIFKEVLIDSFLDNYQTRIFDRIEANRQESLKSYNGRGVDPSDKSAYYEFELNKTLDEFEQELANMRKKAEGTSLVKLSLDGLSAGYDAKAVVFDVRENRVDINATSNFISGLYEQFNKSPDFAVFLRNTQKCSSFKRGLPTVKGGKSKATKTEIKYCTEEFVKNFQKKVYSIVADRFKDLPEKIYYKLQKVAKAHVTAPTYENIPAVEALHVADATDTWFKNGIGCGFVDVGESEFVPYIATKTATRSFLETCELWNPIYRADIVYLVDDPEKTYSDGTPAKRYLSVQVKSGKPHLGSGTVDSSVLDKLRGACKRLEKPKRGEEPEGGRSLTLDERKAISIVFRGLCRGGYVVTTEDWDKWVWLPDDYTPGAESLRPSSSRFSSTEKEYKTYLVFAGHTFHLRVSKADKKAPRNEGKIWLDLVS